MRLPGPLRRAGAADQRGPAHWAGLGLSHRDPPTATATACDSQADDEGNNGGKGHFDGSHEPERPSEHDEKEERDKAGYESHVSHVP